jgi:hypothetical protein
MSEMFDGLGGDTRRRVWLSSLAVAVRPGESEKTVEKLVKMLPLLAAYSDEAFNDATLRDAAVVSTGIPNAKALIGVLEAWVVKNRPRVPLLASPDEWRKTQASPYPTREELEADWSRTDYIRQAVSDIQRRIAWDMMAPSEKVGIFAPEPPEGPAVVLAVELNLAGMLTACVGKFAPQNLGLLPPPWIEEWQRKMKADGGGHG